MDIERTDNTRGLAGTALGLGAGALGVQLLNGGLGGLFGGWGGYNMANSDNMPVSRYDSGKDATIARLETEKMLLESNIYTDSKLNDLRNYVERKFDHVEHELCEQKVFNATAINNVSCLSGQVAQLMALTKLVVPNSSICPGWGEATVSVSAGTTTA